MGSPLLTQSATSRVVLKLEQPAAWPAALQTHFEPPCLARLCAARQAHRKDRTLARLARHRHVAAHHACELAREGKSEPRAAEALCSRGIGLAELFEQLSLRLRSHANAGVSDRELDPLSTVGDLARP